jgi:hypothetical protein
MDRADGCAGALARGKEGCNRLIQKLLRPIPDRSRFARSHVQMGSLDNDIDSKCLSDNRFFYFTGSFSSPKDNEWGSAKANGGRV